MGIEFYELIISFDEAKFNHWLADSVNNENHYFEFKSIFPIDLKGKDRLINSIAAYANTKGGVIIFGVSDSDHKCVGVNPDNEIRKKISDLIKKIKPPLKSNWDIIKEVDLINRKKIYFLQIPESLHEEKPHVSPNNMIYIRSNGSCDPITDGRDIRSNFFQRHFSPDSISSLDYEFSKIQKSSNDTDYLDAIYIKELQKYLEEKSLSSKDFLYLVILLKEIISLSSKIVENTPRVTKLEDLGEVKDETVNDATNLLKTKMTEFLLKYKQIHGLI